MSNYLREIKAARIDAERLTVELTDGSTFTVPLTSFPTLPLASEDERNAMEVDPYSLHWETLDIRTMPPPEASDFPAPC